VSRLVFGDLLRASYDFAVQHHEDFLGQASAATKAEIDRHAASRAPEVERPAAE
jgi:hypothetical protein